jgi:hypothetical protein
LDGAGRGDILRPAAQVLLEAWSELAGSEISPLVHSIAGLRATLVVQPASISVDAPRGPNQAQVLAMRRRAKGASGPQIAEAMGWAPHTVRGFLAGLAKTGMAVEVVERVRQVGPNRTGAKGSYSVYRIARN